MSRYLALSMVGLFSLGVGGCDDHSLIASAKSACIELARTHLRLAPRSDLDLEKPLNTSDDPYPNQFEFVWSGGTSGPSKPFVLCRGDAGKRLITKLVVGDEQVVTTSRAF